MPRLRPAFTMEWTRCLDEQGPYAVGNLFGAQGMMVEVIVTELPQKNDLTDTLTYYQNQF